MDERSTQELIKRLIARRIAPAPLELRRFRFAPPLAETAAEAAALVREVRTACEPLWRALQAAVQHSDACSPYLAGRRGYSATEGKLGTVGRFAALRARAESAGAPLAAAQSLIDLLRFAHDVARGGPPLTTALLRNMLFRSAIPELEAILNEKPFGSAELETLGRELAVLARTEPDPRDSVAGDEQLMMPISCVAPFKPAGWEPPGLPRDLRGLLAEHQREFGGRQVEHLASCQKAYQEKRQRREIAKAAPTPYDGALALRARETADQKEGGLSKYVFRLGESAFLLSAARLHVAARLAALRKGAWPTVEETARLPEARGDSFTGRPLQIARQGDFLVVSPGVELTAWDSSSFFYAIRVGGGGTGAKRTGT